MAEGRPTSEAPQGELTHVDAAGSARMVDVSGKAVTRRRASAEGRIRMRAETLAAIRRNALEKGDVCAVARLAAFGGAKRAAEWIPLCHPLPLDGVEVGIHLEPELPGVRVRVEASAEARTGVEMEALCGVAAGLLAVYDMCKGRDRGMEMEQIRVLEKEGGVGGRWVRPELE